MEHVDWKWRKRTSYPTAAPDATIIIFRWLISDCLAFSVKYFNLIQGTITASWAISKKTKEKWGRLKKPSSTLTAIDHGRDFPIITWHPLPIKRAFLFCHLGTCLTDLLIDFLRFVCVYCGNIFFWPYSCWTIND